MSHRRLHKAGCLVTIFVLMIVLSNPAIGVTCHCLCCDETAAHGHHHQLPIQTAHDNRCDHCSWDPLDQSRKKNHPSLITQTIDIPVRLATTAVFLDTPIFPVSASFTEPGKVVRSAPPLFLQTLSIRC